MSPWIRRSLVGSVFLMMACGGSGGGGCSSCSGITPLPTGFPTDKRVQNAATLRLTKSGFDVVTSSLPNLVTTALGSSGAVKNGVIDYPFGSCDASGKCGLSFDAKVGTATVCANGPDATASPPVCIVEIDLSKASFDAGLTTLALTSATPHEITLGGNLRIRAQDIPVHLLFDLYATLGNGSCGDPVDYASVPLNVDISVETDLDKTHGERYGLSHIKVVKVDPQLTQDQVQICSTCDPSSFLCGLENGALGLVKGFVFSTLVNQITGALQPQIENALCTKADATMSPQCPAGATPADPSTPGSICQFADGSCVSTLLGLEGNIDLGALVAGFSPTTTGGLDFELAVGGDQKRPDNSGFTFGDLNPTSNGATLGMVGGALPDPEATCVKIVAADPPTNIPTPIELLGNDAKGWPAGTPGPDFGLGLSERFLNYMLTGVYNSGLLCLTVGTAQVSLLTTQTIGIEIDSVGKLALQKQTAPIGIVVRPQAPPTVTVGGGTDPVKDPTLLAKIPQMAIDFYVWSDDRYVRAFTYTADVAVPVTLSVTAAGITPVLSSVAITNATVTNSELLVEDPKTVATALTSIVQGFAGQALGGVSKPIDLSSALAATGFTLVLPEGAAGMPSPAIQKLTSGSDNFLAIFAAIEPAATTTSATFTSASFFGKDIDPKAMHVATMTGTARPKLTLTASSSAEGAGPIEYGVRVDNGMWKPWTTATPLTVEDDYLRVQGNHRIWVRSRIAGQPLSESTADPVDVMIDVDAPDLFVQKKDDVLIVDTFDAVFGSDVEVRWSADGGPFSPWQKAADLPVIDAKNAFDVTVQARDPEGNIGTSQQALRGRPDETLPVAAASGCGCSVPGGDGHPPAGLPAAALVVGLSLAWMRRKRRLETAAGAAVLGAMTTFQGCSCNSDSNNVDNTKPISGGSGGTGGAGGSGGTVAVTGGAGGKVAKTCAMDPDCVILKPGLVGAYTSLATTTDGTVWVAGYNEAWYDSVTQDEYPYGDLVVGTYTAATGTVAWKTVDGTDPDETNDPTASDPTSWRGGLMNPGDDVGLWTSMQIGADGNPIVSYYDSTHKALKLAQLSGAKWTIQTVEQTKGADLGRYAKLVLVGGVPKIAYLSIATGTDGFVVSKVRLATGNAATPTAWTFEDINVNDKTPCTPAACTTGKKCEAATHQCTTPLATCTAACAAGESCFAAVPSTGGAGGAGSGGATAAGGAASGDAACSLETVALPLSYPEATGLYISAAVNGSDLGLVFYDRIRGALYTAHKDAATWTVTPVAGQTPDGTDTGDQGIGASLAIDAKGDWHISYVDGLAESLSYLKVAGGKTPGTPETIDAGIQSDGQHIVGDDSNIAVDSSGAVRVAYQDATTGKLRYAVRSSGGTWTPADVTGSAIASKFAGAFSHQVTAGGKASIATWWRIGAPEIAGDVAFLPAPN